MLREGRSVRVQRGPAWRLSDTSSDSERARSYQVVMSGKEKEKEDLAPTHDRRRPRSRSRIKLLGYGLKVRTVRILAVCLMLLLLRVLMPRLRPRARARPFLGEDWETSPPFAGFLGFGAGDADADAEEGWLVDDELVHAVATPIPVGFLNSPPRIDRVKLLSRLTKADAVFADEDGGDERLDFSVNEADMEAIPRWPLLIDRIPTAHSDGPHEKLTTELADFLFCRIHPCKVLLPAWTRALSPEAQRAQIHILADLAARLNRTLVLPNAGPAETTTAHKKLVHAREHEHDRTRGQQLALGTCPRAPLARYFDVASLLSLRGVPEPSAVPMQPFLEWAKHRPTHPSAQMLVVDDAPDHARHGHAVDEAHVDDAVAAPDVEMRNWKMEMKVLEEAVPGRGRHKNCLSARAPKLNFKGRPTLAVSPAAIAGRARAESGHPNMLSDYSALALLDNLEALVKERLELKVPDVLVLEWDWALTESEASSGVHALGYSPRLETLASELVSSLPKPFIVVHSYSAATQWDSLDSEKQLQCLRSTTKRINELVANSSRAEAPEDNNANDQATGNSDSGVLGFAGDEDEISERPAQGTVWLETQLAKSLLDRLRGTDLEGSSSVNHPLLAVVPDANAEEDDADAVCDATGLFLASNFTLTSLADALSSYARHRGGRVPWYGRLADVLDDQPMLGMLENIVMGMAEYVVPLKC